MKKVIITVLLFCSAFFCFSQDFVFQSKAELENASWLFGGLARVVNFYEGIDNGKSHYYNIKTSTKTANGLDVIYINSATRAFLVPEYDDGIYSAESLGIVTGDLVTEFPSLYYDSLESLRKRNMDTLKSIWGNYIYFKFDREMEIHPTYSDKFKMGENTKYKISGTSKLKSKIEIHPLHGLGIQKVGGITYDFYALNDGCFLEIEDIAIHYPRMRFEHYDATLKVSGDDTKVQITSSILRSNLVISSGDTIYTSYDASTTKGEEHIVSSYDSGTKTVTLQGTLLGAVPSDQAGKLILLFPDSIGIDTIKEYGGFYRNDKYWQRGIVAEKGGGATDSINVRINNLEIIGFESAIVRSGRHADYIIENSYIEGDIVGLGWFNGAYALINSLRIVNCDIARNGRTELGWFTGNSPDLTSATGLYMHPNACVNIISCNVYENLGQAIRWSSSGGNNPVHPSSAKSVIKDTKFWKNGEYNISCSSMMNTYISGCYIYGGNFRPGLNTTVEGTTFEEAHIQYSAFNEPDAWDGYVYNTFDNCKFFDFSMATAWQNMGDSLILKFINCTIDPLSTDYAITDGGATPQKRLEFINCDIGNYRSREITNTRGFLSTGSLFKEIVFEKNNIDTGIVQLFYRTTISDGNWDDYSIVMNDNYVATSLGIDWNGSIGGLFSGHNNHFVNGCISSGGNNNFSTGIGYGGYRDTATVNSIPNTLHFDWKYNTYSTKGHFTRIGIGKNASDNRNWNGRFTLIAQGDSIIIEPYSVNTNSNFLKADTILHGESVMFYHKNDTVLAGGTSSTSNAVIFVGDGSETVFQKRDATNIQSNIVPGTVNVTDGSTIFVDSNRDGVLYSIAGDGGTGRIDYKTQYIYLKFNTAPDNLDNIDIDYDYYTAVHHQGAIYRIK